ncbi:mobile mystery protein B [Riemerella columbina]|uniref:mobile mystery protein B n=1 Tax=Riemerella columbina TaxID=103810 RepID=UPI0003746B9C|nr:mobile mystery protein B [Riemerella columbina]
MGLDFQYIDGQTPLDEEEKEGLLIPTVTTREELDEFEQKNIEEAILWVLTKKLKKETIFTEKFIRDLHKKMYGSVWKWAGNFRQSNKNIGIDYWKISTELKMLLDDALFWIENKNFPEDELAIIFKHRLVSIHCFPNGNGRHSRLMADIIISKVFGQRVFSWGGDNLSYETNAREIYLKAIKLADKGNYSALIKFSRT